MADNSCPECGHSPCFLVHDVGGKSCLKRQLAASEARIGVLEAALEFYADPLKHNLLGEVNDDHGAIARKALHDKGGTCNGTH